PKPGPCQYLGSPHEARDRVPVWIVRTDVTIDDSPERVVRDITGHGTVIVVLSDDDVGCLLPAELANLGDDPAQNLVVHLRRIDRVVRPGPIRVIRRVRLL